MTVFADSSALVKRYAEEPHHDIVRAIDEPITVSTLARVEVPSALWRKHRRGQLDDADAILLLAQFELDWYGHWPRASAFVAIDVTLTLVDAAAAHVARHGLRAYDGVQLATALAVRAVDPTTSFAAFDAELRSAAMREGFSLIPPSLDPR